MKKIKLTAVMYHYVRDTKKTEFPGLKALPIADFERQLDYLEKEYNLISWPALLEFLRGKEKLPKRACLLTFDDGLRDHYLNVYPRLKSRGLSGLFFCIARRSKEGLALVQLLQLVLAKVGDAEFPKMFTGALTQKERKDFEYYYKKCEKEYPPDRFGQDQLRNIRRAITAYMPELALLILRRIFNELIGDEHVFANDFYLNNDEILEMASGGMHFGGHGTTHFRLPKINAARQAREIAGSAKFLERIEKMPWAFSYPYGDYNEALFPILKENNFAAAFSIEGKKEHSNPYVIGRIDTIFLPH